MIHAPANGVRVLPGRLDTSSASRIFRRTIELYKAHPDHRDGVVDQELFIKCAGLARKEDDHGSSS